MRISLSHRQYWEQRQTMTILNNDIIYGDNRIRSNSDQMLTRLSDCLPILVQCWSQSWSYTICPITTVVVQFKILYNTKTTLGRRVFIAQPKYLIHDFRGNIDDVKVEVDKKIPHKFSLFSWMENMFGVKEAPYDQSLNLKRRLGFEFETQRGWRRGKIKSRYQLYMDGWDSCLHVKFSTVFRSFYKVCISLFSYLVYGGGPGDKFAHGGDTFKLKVSWIN